MARVYGCLWLVFLMSFGLANADNTQDEDPLSTAPNTGNPAGETAEDGYRERQQKLAEGSQRLRENQEQQEKPLQDDAADLEQRSERNTLEQDEEMWLQQEQDQMHLEVQKQQEEQLRQQQQQEEEKRQQHFQEQKRQEEQMRQRELEAKQEQLLQEKRRHEEQLRQQQEEKRQQHLRRQEEQARVEEEMRQAEAKHVQQHQDELRQEQMRRQQQHEEELIRRQEQEHEERLMEGQLEQPDIVAPLPMDETEEQPGSGDESQSLDLHSLEAKRSESEEGSQPSITWPDAGDVMTASEEATMSFESGLELLNSSTPAYNKAYEQFVDAAKLGHVEAREHVAVAYMVGDHLPRDWARAFDMFSALAQNHGSSQAQFYLGLMHAFGISVNASQSKALLYYTFAAMEEEPMAKMALGYRYFGGLTVTEDCETALAYYSSVAEQVVPHVSMAGSESISRVRLTDDSESASPITEDTVQYYQYRALKSDVGAQVALGNFYYRGNQGVQRNLLESLHFFNMAYNAGETEVGGHIGLIYAEGSKEIPQDNVTALRYYQASIKENSPAGHYGLGVFYLNGQGVPKDNAKALDHLRKAARLGWPDAQLQLGILSFKRKDNPNYAEATNYFTQASQSGSVLAYYYLARIHAEGLQTIRSCPTALGLFKSVAERGRWSKQLMVAYNHYKAKRYEVALLLYIVLAEAGYEVAQSNVAFLLDKGLAKFGFSTHSMYQKAVLHWSRAAGQGAVAARVRLGDYHYYGLGTDVDFENAALHYRVASDQQQSAQAMFNLGFMHENGIGLKQDLHLAKRMYDQAAKASPDASVPVTLALFKLHAKLYMDWIPWLKETIDKGWSKAVPEDWDVGVMTVLAMVLGVVLLVRRAAQHHNARLQQQQLQADLNAQALADAIDEQTFNAGDGQQQHRDGD